MKQKEYRHKQKNGMYVLSACLYLPMCAYVFMFVVCIVKARILRDNILLHNVFFSMLDTIMHE